MWPIYSQRENKVMKTVFAWLGAVTMSAFLSVGCGPRPVVVEEKATEQPAVEVDVNRNGVEVERTADPNEEKGVDVQVGGGQGVEVEVEGK
jgi:hypothetical protein